MDHLLRDLKLAVRTLSKAPLFTFVVVLTIALGIGANATIFTWIKAVALKPIPGVENTSDIVTMNGGRGRAGSVSNGFWEYTYIRDNAKSFRGVFAHEMVILSLSEEAGRPEFVVGSVVSGNYFEVLGVRPSQGRAFTQQEDLTPNAHPLAVISHKLWQWRFASDSNLLGKSVRLNSHPFTVIGIMPPGFSGVYGGIAQDVWVPLQMQGQVTKHEADLNKTGRWMQIMARLAPGVTLEQSRAEVALLAAQLEKAEPERNRDWRIQVYPLLEAQRGLQSSIAPVLFIVMGVVGLVLLIVCANLAGLLLSRAVGRQKEIAVRLALGAGRGQIVRQLLTESLLLSAIGGVAGVIASAWTAQALLTLFPLGEISLGLDLAADRSVLLFSAVASLLTGVLFGLAPAMQSTKTDIVGVLKAEAGAISGGAQKTRMRNALVVSQIALSMVSLVVAGLFLRAVQRGLTSNPGFTTDYGLVASYDLSLGNYGKDRVLTFHRQLLERASALPGVQAAGLTSFVPMGIAGGGSGHSVTIEGYVPRAGENPKQDVTTDVISPGFLKTLGIALAAGREFTAQDSETATPVAIINDTFAQKYWPGQSALGRRVQVAGVWREVVGVTRNTKYRQFNEEPFALMYLPVLQEQEPNLTIVLRTAGDPGAAWPALQRVFAELDPNLAIFQVKTLENHVASSFIPQRIAALLLGVFGSLALFLAALGLYGLLSYAVQQRRREIGVRMAIGAAPRDILRLITGQGLLLVLAGSAVGLVLAFAASRALGTMLLGVSAADPLTFLAVAALLGIIALAACVIPALRAMRIDPVIAIRYD